MTNETTTSDSDHTPTRIKCSDVADADPDPEGFQAWVEHMIPGYKPTHHHGTSYVGMALTLNDIAERLNRDPPSELLAEVVAWSRKKPIDEDELVMIRRDWPEDGLLCAHDYWRDQAASALDQAAKAEAALRRIEHAHRTLKSAAEGVLLDVEIRRERDGTRHHQVSVGTAELRGPST